MSVFELVSQKVLTSLVVIMVRRNRKWAKFPNKCLYLSNDLYTKRVSE